MQIIFSCPVCHQHTSQKGAKLRFVAGRKRRVCADCGNKNKPLPTKVAKPKVAKPKAVKAAPTKAKKPKITRIPTPPPRFTGVTLPTQQPACTSRAGSEDYKKYQKPGRF